MLLSLLPVDTLQLDDTGDIKRQSDAQGGWWQPQSLGDGSRGAYNTKVDPAGIRFGNPRSPYA